MSNLNEGADPTAGEILRGIFGEPRLEDLERSLRRAVAAERRPDGPKAGDKIIRTEDGEEIVVPRNREARRRVLKRVRRDMRRRRKRGAEEEGGS